MRSSQFTYCSQEGDVHHTFFVCKRLAEERRLLTNPMGVIIIADVMLLSENTWRAIASHFQVILHPKLEEGYLGDP